MISIIIPTFNRAYIIHRCIFSVLNQTYQDFEIIIIDDASTDNTEEVIQSFSDERINYYKLRENAGGGSARKKGIEIAKGEYVSFLDSDDEWMPEMLETSLNMHLNLANRRTILFSKLLKDNKKTKKVFPKSIYKNEDVSEYIFCRNGLIHTITLFMQKSLALEINFKEGLKKHQDYDFVLRAYKAGVCFKMIEEVLAIWHCEKRKDRMGQKSEYEYSYNWLVSNKNLFSAPAYSRFAQHDIIGQIMNEKQLYKGVAFLIRLNREGVLPNIAFIVKLSKFLLIKPYRIGKYIFKSITPNQKQII